MPKYEPPSDAEREQLLGIPTERDDLARLYTFEPMDIELIRLRREDRNRLGIGLNWPCFVTPARRWRSFSIASRGYLKNCCPLLLSNLACPPSH